MATLLLVDDHSMLREGLALAVHQLDPTMRIATARSGLAAIDLARLLPELDVVVMDFYLPDIGGSALVRRILLHRPKVRILVLSASEDPADIRDALAAGAHGFVHKSYDSRLFLDSVRRVLFGEINVVMPARPHEDLPRLSSDECVTVPHLTRRQYAVLCLLCEGLRNAAIAEQLKMSEKTVKTHISSIFTVLEVSNRTQAALVARRAGLLGKPM